MKLEDDLNNGTMYYKIRAVITVRSYQLPHKDFGI
jgi:hypothetical protein